MAQIANIIKSIGEKTQVINDIVFQTKLLSFNASVEAARAGEHGKGFAVVAEEVGNLAAMSGKASSEIYEMLESSIASVEKVAQDQKKEMDELITDSKKNIDRGTSLGQESESFLSSLMAKMKGLQENVGQIAGASQEQAKGISEISKAIMEINDATRTNSNIASDTSRISSELDTNTDRFTVILEDLNALINSELNKTTTSVDEYKEIIEEKSPTAPNFDDSEFKDVI